MLEAAPESQTEAKANASGDRQKTPADAKDKTKESPTATITRDRQGPPLAFVPAAAHAGMHAFGLARYETTRGEYAAFAKATARAPSACREPLQPLSRLKNLNWRDPGFAQDDRHPVVCVSWRDAIAYAAWLSQITHAEYRLPTRGEWLQAARGVASNADACARGNLAGHRVLGILPRAGCKSGYAHTAPIGQFGANLFGVHDLVGNVAEWTLNCNSGAVDTAGRCSDHWYIGTSWRDSADASPLTIGDAAADVGYTTVGIRLLRKLDASSSK